jgi:hypothetical protein
MTFVNLVVVVILALVVQWIHIEILQLIAFVNKDILRFLTKLYANVKNEKLIFFLKRKRKKEECLLDKLF